MTSYIAIVLLLVFSGCKPKHLLNAKRFDMSDKDYSTVILNRTNKKGSKKGVWLESVENGYCYVKYKNGEKNGLSMCYSSDSVLLQSFEYKNDMRHGKFTEYLPSGSIVQIGIYIEDSLVIGNTVDMW